MQALLADNIGENSGHFEKMTIFWPFLPSIAFWHAIELFYIKAQKKVVAGILWMSWRKRVDEDFNRQTRKQQF